MNVNDDFSKRVLLHANQIPWESSPMAGVERRRLDRVILNDVERVTTIVRYAPQSRFSAHTHSGGEEFIVLEGTFQDEYGDWPEGSYVRNPPGSKHTPGSHSGCTIFVKLQQFEPNDRTFVHINLHKIGAVNDANRKGVRVTPLFEDCRERVQSEQWQASSQVECHVEHGVEILMLSGEASFVVNGDAPLPMGVNSWLRLPPNTFGQFYVGAKGAKVWLKEFTKPLQV